MHRIFIVHTILLAIIERILARASKQNLYCVAIVHCSCALLSQPVFRSDDDNIVVGLSPGNGS